MSKDDDAAFVVTKCEPAGRNRYLVTTYSKKYGEVTQYVTCIPDPPPSKEERARAILTDWVAKQGHDRCWYYPEVFSQLCDLFGVKAPEDRGLPPEAEFEAGCDRYRRQQYGADPPSEDDSWKSHADAYRSGPHP